MDELLLVTAALLINAVIWRQASAKDRPAESVKTGGEEVKSE